MQRLKQNIAPRWLEIAEKELGVKEIRGRRHHPKIIEYLHTAKNLGNWGRSRDETPWCAAFVNWALHQAGEKGTEHALAASFIDWGFPSDPRLGAVCVLKYKGDRDASTGSRGGFHVGFFIHETKYSFRILGGNQADRVSYRNFPKKMYDLVALRWPSPADNLKQS